MEYFVTTLHYTLHWEDAPFLKLKEKPGLHEGTSCILFVFGVSAYSHCQCPAHELEGMSPLHVFDDSHLRIRAVILGSRYKLKRNSE